MYKKILAVVDGSEQSDQALKKASLTAEKYGAGLAIGHVIDTRSFPKASPYGDDLWGEIKKSADELLESSKEQSKALGIRDVRTVVLSGNPRVEIPEKLVEEDDIDLLVVGGSGLNTVERMVVGSVTEACVRRAPSDVLTVKNETGAALYRNILVAMDGSEQSEQALAKAIDVAKTHDGSLKISHVIENQERMYAHPYIRLDIQQQKSHENGSDKDIEQKKMLEKYKRQAEVEGVKDVETILYYGNPRSEIPQTLTVQNDIDLLVTAATGKGAVKRFFAGSVAHASVHHAPCDILTVRK